MSSNKKIDDLALKAFHQCIREDVSSLGNLLTHQEKIKIGRRILIAQAIVAGKTRFEINNHLSVSPNTFRQIRKWLESEFYEYSSAHNLTPHKKKRAPEHTELLSYKHLKKKYPAHFLLFSLVEELFKIKK